MGWILGGRPRRGLQMPARTGRMTFSRRMRRPANGRIPAALFFNIEAKAQTARINPTLTDLGQPPYNVVLTQGVCDLVQGLEGTTHKAVTLLNHGDSLPMSAAEAAQTPNRIGEYHF
jgi:hypothetical protein